MSKVIAFPKRYVLDEAAVKRIQLEIAAKFTGPSVEEIRWDFGR